MEDNLVSERIKRWKFLNQSVLLLLGARKSANFLVKVVWDPRVPTKVGFLCMGSNVGEDFDCKSAKKKGMDFGK